MDMQSLAHGICTILDPEYETTSTTDRESDQALSDQEAAGSVSSAGRRAVGGADDEVATVAAANKHLNKRLEVDEEQQVVAVTSEESLTASMDPPARYRSNSTSGGVQESFEVVDHGISNLRKIGSYSCRPYKKEVVLQQISGSIPGSERRAAIVESLRDLGVKIYIIDSSAISDTRELISHLRVLVSMVAKENAMDCKNAPLGFQRCLLYQDRQGRLFNLTLTSRAAASATQWHQYMENFSATEAIVALTILCRSFPCTTQASLVHNLKPAYLSLIFGLVLSEEVGLSWLNSGMLIRHAPSISAHSLMSKMGVDSLRKIVIFCLAIAGATTGNLQRILTVGGIGGACVLLLANLGARTWHFLRWKPQQYSGPLAGLMGYVLAIVSGAALPFLAQKSVGAGGKAAMESVIRSAVIVAIVFTISGYKYIRNFLVIGSAACKQDTVNLLVSGWWFISFICSLIVVRSIEVPPARRQKFADGEHLLIKDQSSPVGYKVEQLPDFEIDPNQAMVGFKYLSVFHEFLMGLFLAVCLGAGMIYISFPGDDSTYTDFTTEISGLY